MNLNLQMNLKFNYFDTQRQIIYNKYGDIYGRKYIIGRNNKKI